MSKFTVEDASRLADALVQRHVMPLAEAGAFATALSEIHDEANELFSSLIPALMIRIEGTEDLKQLIWDIQEACAHIHHHAKECKLADDSDPWIHLHSSK